MNATFFRPISNPKTLTNTQMNPLNIFRASNLLQIKSQSFNQTLQNALFFFRSMSKSTSIPQNQQRIRDHGYDNYMEIEKKLRRILKFEDLILTQPRQCVPISRLETLARRLGFKQQEAGKFVLKFPRIFEIYEHPVQRILYLRLTRDALLQIEQEQQAIVAQIPNAVIRLRKLLMLSNTGRLRLEHLRIARRDFGLPEDFEFSVVLNHPQYFRLFDDGKEGKKYVEIVEKDPKLAVCAVEETREMEYRRKGMDEENMRFSFVVNFPPGFKLGKYYKVAMWKWQRLPYWSPYEDISGYDIRSFEAQNRWEKRAVAMIHEILSLTVERKITLERIAHFRTEMDLPKKLKDFLLQHQGVFYISTRGNHGKLHTIFLREAYRKGELIEPNEVYLARRRLAELVMVGPRKARVEDRELAGFRRNELAGFDVGERRGIEQDSDSEEESDAGLDFSDGDEDLHHVEDANAD